LEVLVSVHVEGTAYPLKKHSFTIHEAQLSSVPWTIFAGLAFHISLQLVF